MKRILQNSATLSFTTTIIIFGILLMVIPSCKKENQDKEVTESSSPSQKSKPVNFNQGIVYTESSYIVLKESY